MKQPSSQDPRPGVPLESSVELLFDGDPTRVHRTRTTEGQPVVVKTRRSADDAGLRHEFQIARALSGKHVVQAYALDHDAAGDASYMVLEDIGGRSLDVITGERALPLDEILDIVIQVADGLGEIHAADIIHKDITPENIVYNPDTGVAKIIDFGISSYLTREQADLTSPTMLEGSLRYLSPEQTGRMNRALDYRTDFYSLGATLYELLTRRPMFDVSEPIEWLHCHIARRPVAPHRLDEGIPEPLSDVVMRLLEKGADERYQSAQGIRNDLAHCRDRLRAVGTVEPFALGQADLPVRFQIQQRLYGREAEIDRLLKAFERARGAAELVLVAGYSGIGKSCLVKELYRPITERRGYFVSGKFDQLHRTVPLSAPVAALRALVRQLLTEPEHRLAEWRESLDRALAGNGALLTGLIPELGLIIGDQPMPVALSAEAAEIRFNRTLVAFVGAFCATRHPLVLFLDDLQWADTATLALLELLLSEARLSNLLIIGAYRDNEVHDAHPMRLAVERIVDDGGQVESLTLKPLSTEHLTALLGDALHATPQAVAPLAELIELKTGGNPFFTEEFLKFLDQKRLIALDPQSGRWQWDVERIAAEGMTDNVIDLMSARLERLSPEARRMLEIGACIGHRFELRMLAAVCGQEPATLDRALREAMGHGLVAPIGGARLNLQASGRASNAHTELAFAHDRIQQAAHALLDEDARQRTHLQIAEILIATLSDEDIEAHLFRITDHLNSAGELVADSGARARLCDFNTRAGRQASRSAAYDAANYYLERALALLADDAWNGDPQGTRRLYADAADAACHSGRHEACDRLLDIALAQVDDPLEATRLNDIRLASLSAQGRHAEAVALGKSLLAALGEPYPSAARWQLNRAYLSVNWRTRNMTIDDLRALPELRDPTVSEKIRVAEKVAAAAHYGQPELLPLMVLRGVRKSLRHGISERSAYSFSGYSVILCTQRQDLDRANLFGAFAMELCDRFPASKTRGRIEFQHTAYVQPWSEPVHRVIEALPRSYELCLAAGDFEGAAQVATYLANYLYPSGMPLKTAFAEALKWRGAVAALNHRESLEFVELILQMLENLTGGSANPLRLKGRFYDYARRMPHHEQAGERRMAVSAAVRQAGLLHAFDQHDEALLCADRVLHYVRHFETVFDGLVVHALDALIRLAVADSAGGRRRRRLLVQVDRSRRLLARWAARVPANALARRELVEAEWQRVHGRPDLAQAHFDGAIIAARQHRLLGEEAMANRLCGEMHHRAGRYTIAQAYLRKACDAYRRWQADAVVEHLQRRHPELVEPAATQRQSRTWSTTGGTQHLDLDLSALMKSLRAIAEERVYSRMVSSIVTIALEFAGAQHGVLLLRGTGRRETRERFFVEAEASVDGGDPQILQSLPVESCGTLSQSVVNYVARTRRSIVIHDAQQAGDEIPGLDRDDYVLRNRVSSILCLPIIAATDSDSELIGMLYLENNRASHTFTEARFDTLEIIVMAAAGRLELSRKAAVDGLTHLYNREYFQSMLHQELVASRRHGRSLALVLADIDHFKLFNDTWGHQLGDDVLKSVADAVKSACREADIAARYGGEELVVILPDTDGPGAEVLAERVRRAVESLVLLHGKEHLCVTVSVGVAVLTDSMSGEDDLLRAADEALYQAKHAGRNRVVRA